MKMEKNNGMVKLLEKLTELVEQGRLEIEGVTIHNSHFDIELGNDAEHFEGDIKLRVVMDTDVIQFGNMLSEAMKGE